LMYFYRIEGLSQRYNLSIKDNTIDSHSYSMLASYYMSLPIVIFFLIIASVNLSAVVEYEADLLNYYAHSLNQGESLDVIYNRKPNFPQVLVTEIAERCLNVCRAFSVEEYREELQLIWKRWTEKRQTACADIPHARMPFPASFFDFVDKACITTKELEDGTSERTKWSCGHHFPVPSFQVCGPVIRLTHT
jgi:hypothetical protein